jgi:hypothetical protein
MYNIKINIQEYFLKSPKVNFIKAFKYFIYSSVFREFEISSFQLGLPWLNFAAIDFINDFLENKKNLNVCEYGSGGSTLFFLRKGYKVVSIEHCKEWHVKSNSEINKNHFFSANWKSFLVEPEYDGIKQTKSEYSNPLCYKSADFNNYNFQKYVSTIDQFPDAVFDIILIDGRARPSCIAHASKKVKMGGIIIIDNTERDYYLSESTKKILEEYRIIFDAFAPIIGVKTYTRTSIFQR